MLLSLSFLLKAQNKNLHFGNLNQDKRIFQQQITSIAQGKKGFIWLGTTNGLERFDGYKFKSYTNDSNNNESLSSNHITALEWDDLGYLWVATYDGGLNKFDPKSETFKRFKHDSKDLKSISNNTVNTLLKDKQNNIWIGTVNGLNKYDYSTNSFIFYQNKTIQNQYNVTVIVENDAETLWVGSMSEGISQFNKTTGEFINYRHSADDKNSINSNNITSLLVDKDNHLWIGTLKKGISYYNSSTGIFVQPNFPIDINYSTISQIIQDKNGLFWVATEAKGLFTFTLENMKLNRYEPQAHDTINSLNYSYVMSLFEDDSGVIWIGTERGVNFYHPMHQQFDHYNNNPLDDNSISNNLVWSINKDSSGNLWVATNKGLNRINQETKKVTRYFNDPSDFKSISSDSCLSIANSPVFGLWIGCDTGLNFYNEENDNFIRFSYDKGNPNGLSDNNVKHLTFDSNDILWISTSKGVNRFDPGSKNFTHLKHDKSNTNSLSHKSIDYIFHDNLNHIWIGTKFGLNLYDPTNNQFTRYINDPDDNESISHNLVRETFQDKSGAYWITTYGGGINKFNKKTQKFQRFNQSNGLPNNKTYNFLEDDNGKLWISTDNGISKLDPSTLTFKNYSIKDGLQHQEFTANSQFKDKNGQMYFGGFNGFNTFSPNKIKDDDKLPKLVFTDFLLFNKSVSILSDQNNTSTINNEFDFQLPMAIDEMKTITLNHKLNVFSFDFVGLQYNDPSMNKYAYQLEGFDKEWIHTDADNRRATYTSIASGTYTFKFKASNKNGLWNDEHREIKVIILPAPWLTWWAYLLYFILGALILFFLYSQRSRKIKAIKERNKQLSLTSKLFENTSEGVWILDSNYNYIAVNQGFLDTIGKTEAQVINQPFSIPEYLNQKPEYKKSIFNHVLKGNKWKGEIWNIRSSGELFPTELVVDKIDSEIDSGGTEVKFVGVFTDITQRRNNERKLKKMAFFDSLTQLRNRESFKKAVVQEINFAETNETSFIIMFIDLDDFKLVNDELGHKKGDLFLKELATKFRLLSKEKIIIGRLGGDEFSVLIPYSYIEKNRNSSSLESLAKEIAKKFLNTIAETVILENNHIKVSSSIGIALFPRDGKTYDLLLKNSDTAMYRAKKSGGNLIQLYNNQMNIQASHQLYIAEKMKKDINSNCFVPFFQPRISLSSKSPNNVEVLARWISDSEKPISPGEFIPVAEETGLINQLGDQLLEQACKLMAPRIEQNLFHGRMSINLSTIQFKQENLIERIENILSRTKFPAEHFEIEITESTLMSNIDQAIIVMNQLREKNILISVDDFGTGYSSLSYLAQFPISSLKIDSSFISQMLHNKKDKIIIDSIIKLAHSLDLKVVAEGVENQLELDYLKNAKCDEIQGYYFSPALSISKYDAFLKQ